MANKKPSAHRTPPRGKGGAVEGPAASGHGEGAQQSAADKEPEPPAIASRQKGAKARKQQGARKPPVIPAKGPRPEASARRQQERAAVLEQRRAEKQRKEALERRRRIRKVAILVLAGLVVVGAIVFNRLNAVAARRAFQDLSAAAGCSSVQNTDNNLSHAHLTTGQKATYTTSPPTGGAHNPTPLPAGVYAELSADPNVSPNIYQAVHSMEHGYVVVWYKGLSSQQVDSLGQFGNDFKVIVAPYPQLPTGAVGLTAWGRLQTCQKVSTAQIAQFIKLYRLKTASEPQAP